MTKVKQTIDLWPHCIGPWPPCLLGTDSRSSGEAWSHSLCASLHRLGLCFLIGWSLEVIQSDLMYAVEYRVYKKDTQCCCFPFLFLAFSVVEFFVGTCAEHWRQAFEQGGEQPRATPAGRAGLLVSEEWQ